jgi:hypothetical protein
MCGWPGAPAVDWRVASPWRAGCQGPAAASSCPSPLTRATDSAVLSSCRFAIAQGLDHHAPTGITRSPSLISSPPAHSKQSHWSSHACHLLWSGHLLEPRSGTISTMDLFITNAQLTCWVKWGCFRRKEPGGRISYHYGMKHLEDFSQNYYLGNSNVTMKIIWLPGVIISTTWTYILNIPGAPIIFFIY